MKVTLKRADALAKRAMDAANAMKIDGMVTWSIFREEIIDSSLRKRLDDEMAAARETVTAKTDLILRLVKANFIIRDLLATANHTHGIVKLVNRRKETEVAESRLVAISKTLEMGNARSENDIATAVAKSASLRVKNDVYGGTDTVSVSVMTDEGINAAFRPQIRALQNQRQAINDELTHLNASNTVTLDDETVATLRAADLID